MGISSDLRSQLPTISVGVLTADFMHLGDELKQLEGAGTGLLHFDVMDGCFCPMMTVGPPFIKQIKTPLLKDVHLMVNEPIDQLEGYVKAGADMISVHVESSIHIHRALQFLGTLENASDPKRGLIRGAALNPGTPVVTLEPLLDDVEMIVLLAVNPGWGGQAFIPGTFEKIRQVRKLLDTRNKKEILLCIDGGITKSNIEKVAQSEVDIVVTGSAVFDGKSP